MYDPFELLTRVCTDAVGASGHCTSRKHVVLGTPTYLLNQQDLWSQEDCDSLAAINIETSCFVFDQEDGYQSLA